MNSSYIILRLSVEEAISGCRSCFLYSHNSHRKESGLPSGVVDSRLMPKKSRKQRQSRKQRLQLNGFTCPTCPLLHNSRHSLSVLHHISGHSGSWDSNLLIHTILSKGAVSLKMPIKFTDLNTSEMTECLWGCLTVYWRITNISESDQNQHRDFSLWPLDSVNIV